MTEAKAQRTYDILSLHCGAPEVFREDFVHRLTTGDGRVEYRFGGELGFGGKFYVNSNGTYVACYPEDRTPERQQMIDRANKALAEQES